jgi:hypothetical protein
MAVKPATFLTRQPHAELSLRYLSKVGAFEGWGIVR